VQTLLCQPRWARAVSGLGKTCRRCARSLAGSAHKDRQSPKRVTYGKIHRPECSSCSGSDDRRTRIRGCYHRDLPARPRLETGQCRGTHAPDTDPGGLHAWRRRGWRRLKLGAEVDGDIATVAAVAPRGDSEAVAAGKGRRPGNTCNGGRVCACERDMCARARVLARTLCHPLPLNFSLSLHLRRTYIYT
jgi:hypothetical protein